MIKSKVQMKMQPSSASTPLRSCFFVPGSHSDVTDGVVGL